jgi:predicted RNase H-related nuclease YkuK (DUF458 family)
MKPFDIEEVRRFISASSPETKVYLGADSERIKVDGKWYADYTLAVVVHIDGCHGCKVFGDIQREPDYDRKLSRPANRLMTEVYKISALCIELQDAIGDREYEVHLDINPDEQYGSSCVIGQAVGYIKGTCQIEPKVKPQAFAASYTADRLKFVLGSVASEKDAK